MHVHSYLPRVTTSWDKTGHAACILVHNELRDNVTDIGKLYQKGAPSESDLIEA